ncbi:MAG: hypothetical protein US07_C0009G0002 [Candidatus Levybacteria bacterium GW2011_GWB1_36_18]|nr:MAG: hypothetical protein US07_C0009G0002 [Candidatus Levybacteria bacterium GW2011_GWB1_36_18]
MVNVPKKADVKRAENSLNPKNLTTMEVRYMLAIRVIGRGNFVPI